MLPQVPPPDPASDFGIERTAPMNVTQNRPDRGFAGHGMVRDFPAKHAEQVGGTPDFSQENGSWREDDALMSDALAEDLAKELPKATLLAGKRAALERTIASTRTEMKAQQQIAASALDKARQLKISLRADEDSLDALPFE